VLWCGAADRKRAAQVANRLLQPDLFTGWGIATLSSRTGGYNPLGYHRGTVWPHENALILAGFRRYNLNSEALTLGAAILGTAVAFRGGPIPELFGGDPRGLRTVPTPFPVASRPQAWAAASLPFAMATLLGLRPHASGVTVNAPILPPPLEWVRVRNLRCRDTVVDLTFRKHRDRVSVEVDEVRGVGTVSLAPAWGDD
jgi:glycogen debranching enzyme